MKYSPEMINHIALKGGLAKHDQTSVIETFSPLRNSAISIPVENCAGNIEFRAD